MKINREEKKVELSRCEIRHLLEHFCSLNSFCKSLLYCAGLTQLPGLMEEDVIQALFDLISEDSCGSNCGYYTYELKAVYHSTLD